MKLSAKKKRCLEYKRTLKRMREESQGTVAWWVSAYDITNLWKAGYATDKDYVRNKGVYTSNLYDMFAGVKRKYAK